MTSLRWLIIAILAITGLSLPAEAADGSVEATVASISPGFLTDNTKTVVLTGTVSNRTSEAITDVTVYFVIPRNPFTTRSQMSELLSDVNNAFGGTRNEVKSRQYTVKQIQPGQTIGYRLEVDAKDLGIDGSDGVYPVGVHVLATDSSGERNPDGLARAYSFLPKIDGDTSIPTTIIWPFLSPSYRLADGSYANTEQLLTDIGPDGRLRRYLDTATAEQPFTASVLIDPLLLVALDAIAENRIGPPSGSETGSFDATESALARTYLADLLQFARSNSTWMMFYSRPDLNSLANSAQSSADMLAALSEATSQAVNEFEIVARLAHWPQRGLATTTGLAAGQQDGTVPALVDPATVPGWEPRMGAVIRADTPSGSLPAIVIDPVFSVAENDSIDLVRQKILAQSALAAVDRQSNADSRANTTFLMNPFWNPSGTANLYAALDAPWVSPVTAERLLVSQPLSYDGPVGVTEQPKSLSQEQVNRAVQILDAQGLRGDIAPRRDWGYFSQFAPQALSTRWIDNADEGLVEATAVAEKLNRDLTKLRISGPGQVTLSGSAGQFPLTISNDLAAQVNLVVRVRSSATGVTLPPGELVTIDPGQRVTMTIDVDLGRRAGSTLIAELTTTNDESLPEIATVNVRSSAVGAVIWIGMAAAGLLVVFALSRRFRQKKAHD